MGENQLPQGHTPRIFDEASSARVPTHRHGIACRLAQDQGSFRTAFRLLYDAYVRRGLTQPNRLRLRFLPHHLLASTSVLLAERAGQSLGTLSIFEDADYGLPIESICPQDVALLRFGGKRLVELTCLAAAPMTETFHRRSLVLLFDAAMIVAASRQVDVVTICIHPRHCRFYEERLGFERLGGMKACPWVCNQPAVAMCKLFSKPEREQMLRRQYAIASALQNSIRTENDECELRRTFLPLLSEVSPYPWADLREGGVSGSVSGERQKASAH